MLDIEPTFFDGPAEFREWLEAHRGSETELLVGLYESWAEARERRLDLLIENSAAGRRLEQLTRPGRRERGGA